MTDTKAAKRATANFFANFLGDTSLQEALEDGRSFTYKPQPDITTYELALCMYLISTILSSSTTLRDEQKIYDALPAEVQRHFVVVRNDNDS